MNIIWYMDVMKSKFLAADLDEVSLFVFASTFGIFVSFIGVALFIKLVFG